MFYLTNCPNCGKYPVAEKYFQKSLPKELKKQWQEQIEKGAEGVVLEFEEGCPRCSESSRETEIFPIIIAALHPCQSNTNHT